MRYKKIKGGTKSKKRKSIHKDNNTKKNETLLGASSKNDVEEKLGNKEHKPYSNTLEFSERKDRFLIVITVLAALLTLLKLTLQVLLKMFDKIYVNKTTIFGDVNGSISGEHFIIIFFMATAILIVCKFMLYCLSEARNFVNKDQVLSSKKKAMYKIYTQQDFYV